MKRHALTLGALAVAAMLLAACEDKPADVRPVTSAEDEERLPDAIPPSDADGQPAPVITAPYNLPAYTPVRDNATIEVAQASTPDGEPGGFVTFTTPDAPRALGDFYKTRLSREFGAVTDAANGPARLLSATRDANERVEVSVSPAAEGGARVTISYFLPPGLPPQSEH